MTHRLRLGWTKTKTKVQLRIYCQLVTCNCLALSNARHVVNVFAALHSIGARQKALNFPIRGLLLCVFNAKT